MIETSAAQATMKSKGRSKMTNARFAGKVTSRSLFLDGDGRSPWSRRYRDLVALFADDAGGLSTLTELKLSLIRRAAALVVECERLENALADGKEIDIDLLARMSSHVRRISETIGLERAKRDVTPSLSDILREHAEAAEAAKAAKGAKGAKAVEPLEGIVTSAAPVSRVNDAPIDHYEAAE
jgi:hypothetical protein